MTREEKKNFLLNQLPPNTDCYYVDGFIDGFDCTYDAVLKDFEAQMKAKDEKIERLKKAIDTSIEEIEYAIKKPQYAEVYLGNAIRFLKDNA